MDAVEAGRRAVIRAAPVEGDSVEEDSVGVDSAEAVSPVGEDDRVGEERAEVGE